MREELLYADRPVVVPQGMSMPASVSQGLHFSRSFWVPLDAVLEQWLDPQLRSVWLKPLKNSRFTITHVAPARLEAIETDGVHAVRIDIACEHEGDLTTVSIHIEPGAPVTTAILIASGYADHWEERLYALADALLIHHP
jgi:hypothetical protein